ncbi:MAG: nitroreductase family protein [Spirochaetales bacterium]|nr:nitroreductase family protein [Spirochaetales bacterium]
MALLPIIQNRRSIVRFKPAPVEKSKLDSVLEAGRLAPSAKNRQEWRFVVIQKESLRQKVREAAFGDEKVGEAPVIVALCTTNIEYIMPNGQLSYPIDLAFAASFMLLQAEAEGLGTCCHTTFDEQMVRDLITVPYSMRVVLLLLIGYPEQIPEPTPRKPLRRIVAYDHW